MDIEFNNFSFTAIVAVIFGGIIAASVYAYYSRVFLGGLIRRLDGKKITGEDKAAALSELGYGKVKCFFLKMSLSDNSSLRKYIGTKYTRDEAELLREKKRGEQRYYLQPEKAETALERYSAKNMKLWKLVAGIVISVIAAVGCAVVYPYIIAMI